MIASDILSPDAADPGVDFFVAGGTLRNDAPSYVKRPADDDLYQAIREGNFCYVLTPRQMGKSSLMVRTAHRLRQGGVQSAIVDLTRIGTDLKAEQWYLGLMRNLQKQLNLKTDPQPWWKQHEQLGVVQRFTRFLRDVVLAETSGQVVIFVDEIDSTLKLDFSDDFFAAIRYVYNARATDQAYERLTFVLLGVATPTDLIKNRRRTPFNIGQRIELSEFSRQDANILQLGLQAIYSDDGKAIFDRIFHWTSGHPYLTQKLCLTVGESDRPEWDDAAVDELVEELYLSRAARRETNLQFVRENVAASKDGRQLLTLYRNVYRGEKPVADDERSLVQNRLKLYGLVKAENGRLVVRNAIYRQAFDDAWIQESMPPIMARRVIIAAVLIAVLIVSGIGYALLNQQESTTRAIAERAISDFETNTNPAIRLDALSTLFGLEGYVGRARELFYDLNSEEQLGLFREGTRGLQAERIRTVITGTYVLMDDQEKYETLLVQMRDAVAASEEEESQILENELNSWLDGIGALSAGDFRKAALELGEAIDWSKGGNPAVHFHQALAYLQQSAYAQALLSFNNTIAASVDGDVLDFWRVKVVTIITGDTRLHAAWWETPQTYQRLAALIPEPTATPSPTATPEVIVTGPTPESPTVTPTPQPVVLDGSEGSPHSAVFSLDGSRILTIYNDGSSRLWDGLTGRQLAMFGGHEGIGPESIALFSPDGKYVLTAGSDDIARLWDVTNGKKVIELVGHEGDITSAAFSPDGGRILTGSYLDNTARLWNAASGEELAVLEAGDVSSVHFSPNGQRILTEGGSCCVDLWSGENTGVHLAEIQYGFRSGVTSVVFNPAGDRILITTIHNGTLLVDAMTGEELLVWDWGVYSVAFSPDGKRIVAIGWDGTVQLHEASSGAQIETFTLPEDTLEWAIISPDGSRLFTADSDGTTRLWDAMSGEELIVLSGHESPVTRAAFSPDGSRVLTGSSDGTARLWDATNGENIIVLAEHEVPVWFDRWSFFSPDGKYLLLATSNNDTVELRDATSGTVIAEMASQILMTDPSIGDTVLDLAFSPDGLQLASGGIAGNLGLWSLGEHQLSGNIAIAEWVQAVAYSPDNRYLAAASNNGNVYLVDLDLAFGPDNLWLAAHKGIVFDVAFSPLNQLLDTMATAGGDGTFSVWFYPGWDLLLERFLDDNAVYGLAYSPDGDRLAIAVVGEVNGRVEVWDVESGKQLCRSPVASTLSVAFSPDGQYVAAGNSTGAVVIYDAGSCSPVQLLQGHSDNVNEIAYSPDGQWLLSGSRDATVRLWPLDGATVDQEPVVLFGYEGSVETVAFSPDGRLFATGGEDGRIILWTLPETGPVSVPTPTPSPSPTPTSRPPTPTPTPVAFEGSINLLSRAASATWVNNIGAADVWLDYYPTDETDPNAAPGFAAYANSGQQLETSEAVGGRTVLATHPPFVANGEIRGAYRLTLPPRGASFSARLAFLAGADQEQGTNGVVVQVWWRNLTGGGEPVQLSSDVILYTGLEKNIVADLGDFGGQTGELILVVQARGLPGRDWLTWTAIRVESK